MNSKVSKQTLSCIACILMLLSMSCAKTFQVQRMPDENKPNKPGTIYLFRPSLYGAAASIEIKANNLTVGRIGPQGYLAWEPDAEEVILQAGLAAVKVFPKPGKIYYLSLAPKLTFNRSEVLSFKEISKNDGEAYLSRFKMPRVKVID